MPALNETYDFNRDAPGYVQAAFVGKSARRFLFPAGTRLYKFTEFDVFPVDRKGQGQVGKAISPWWCAVDGVPGTDDPGLDGLIQAAKAAGMSTGAYAREVLAVMFAWNTLAVSQLGMAKVLRITLTSPAYGFYGKCQRMPNDQSPLHKAQGKTRASITGGAYQIWLPNLTAEHFNATGAFLLP